MYFKLFNDCKIVSGSRRAILIDLQRGGYTVIPISMVEIVEHLMLNIPIKVLKKQIPKNSRNIFKEYISFLIENEFGFFTNNYQNFEYNEAYKINNPSINGVIELSNASDIASLVNELQSINIEALHINMYDISDLELLYHKLNILSRISSLSFISLLLKYNSNFTNDDFIKISLDFPTVGCLLLYSSPFDKEITYNSTLIKFSSKHNISNKSCGIVDNSQFSSNEKMYFESKCFNSCLGGKISIDIEGNIKNCPSMPQNFGNIKETTLKEALQNKDFKRYWNLTKDSIEVCKDCEFRYICTDCRAYTEQTHTNNEELDISKPLKCGYNPYTGEWEEWSTNPLKQKAIKYYGL